MRRLTSSSVDLPLELIAKPDAIMLDLTASSREAALRALHAKLAKDPAVTNGERFLRDVLERVMVAPVCIAADIALPHARTDAVSRIVLAMARFAEPGVGFDSEHPNIRLMFLIGTPRQQVEGYLRLVAAISRLLKVEGAKAGLLAAPSELEFRTQLASAAAR